MRLAVMGLAVLLVAGCQAEGEGPPPSPEAEQRPATDADDEPAPSPEDEQQPQASEQTPDGQAALDLIVEPVEVDADEPVSFWLENSGEVELTHGIHVRVEKWDGNRWAELPWPEDYGVPDVEEPLPAGKGSVRQQWPVDGRPHASPGWHRVVWGALWDDEPDFEEPEVRLDVRARFQVRP